MIQRKLYLTNERKVTMQIRHRIVYDKTTASKEFIHFLEERNATIKDNGTDFIVAYINEEEKWKTELFQYLDNEDILSEIELIFSKQEMEEAEWFTIRSIFRWEYPQPDESYMELTYDLKQYCSNCGSGSKQNDSFRVKKEPKWGQRNFLMLNWVEDELFISDKMSRILKEKDLQGYKILNVSHSKKEIPLEHMYQLCVETIMQPALINLDESIRMILRCKECGSVKYIGNGRQRTFKKEAFQEVNVDILKTSEVFGDGRICAREILISKKFYEMLRDNKLDRGLCIEPVKLV